MSAEYKRKEILSQKTNLNVTSITYFVINQSNSIGTESILAFKFHI